MSRAFVKEQDSVDELPDRLISEHANLVTPEGLAHIEAELQRFDDAHAAAQIAGDLAARRFDGARSALLEHAPLHRRGGAAAGECRSCAVRLDRDHRAR